MMSIWLAVAALALLAVAAVVAGALRRPRRNAPDDSAAVFADRRQEVRHEGRAQGLRSGEIDALQEELALDFVAGADTPAPSNAATVLAPTPGRLLLAGIGIALAAGGLYALWGEPNATLLATAPQLLAQGAEGSAKTLDNLEAALATRAARRADDADAWFHLGHVRMRLQDYNGAADAFASLHELIGANEQVGLPWAQASYLAAGGKITPAVQRIIERVLAARPDHPDMLELLANDALRRADYASAARYLAKALRQPLAEHRWTLLERALAATRSRLDAQRPAIEVTVAVAEATAPWLVVFARPVAGGMPLAVARRRAQSVQTVVLDDADSITDSALLSTAGTVEVVARLSATGEVGADGVEAISEPVASAARPRVALTLGSSQRNEAIAGSTESAADGHAGKASFALAVDVSLQGELPPNAAVFVVVRDPQRRRPPLAVRRLTVADLPTRTTLTDANAMLPGTSLSGVAQLELLARVSLSGSAAAQSGDWQSAVVQVQPGDGEPVALRIDRLLP